MKSFGQKSWMLPQPVLIIGTYDKNDADKMAKTGWNVEKAENVNAPVFTDFPMTLECRIKEKIDESAEGYYIVV